jgi:hypothetical protein
MANDILTPPERTEAEQRDLASAEIANAIADLEARKLRPLGPILLAILAGSDVDPDDVAALAAIETEIYGERVKIATVNKEPTPSPPAALQMLAEAPARNSSAEIDTLKLDVARAAAVEAVAVEKGQMTTAEIDVAADKAVAASEVDVALAQETVEPIKRPAI